jgi:alpha-tubulin suppressor-like RCC1 family protein
MYRFAPLVLSLLFAAACGGSDDPATEPAREDASIPPDAGPDPDPDAQAPGDPGPGPVDAADAGGPPVPDSGPLPDTPPPQDAAAEDAGDSAGDVTPGADVEPEVGPAADADAGADSALPDEVGGDADAELDADPVPDTGRLPTCALDAPCDPLTVCEDAPAGPVCGPCPAGTTGTGETGCLPCDPAPGVWAWGRNNLGQLGDGSVASSNVLRPVTPSATDAAGGLVQVSLAFRTACGVSADGNLFCWGSNSDARLGVGLGSTELSAAWAPRPVDRTLVPEGTVFRTVAVGQTSVCALDDTGVLWCWGANGWGQLGTGQASGTPVLRPTRVLGESDLRFVDIALGPRHTCGRTAEGELWCWGDNSVGQVGSARFSQWSAPTPVDVSLLPEGIRFAALAAGSDATCALDTDRGVWCWGTGLAFGRPLNQPVRTPARFFAAGPLEGVAVAEVAVGTAVCIRTEAGVPWCLGEGGQGQTGDGSLASTAAPVRVDLRHLAGDPTWVELSMGGGVGCLRAATGAMACWGFEAGQAGTGGAGNVAVPAVVLDGMLPPGDGPVQLAPDTGHLCVLLASGRPFCAGSNSEGTLGDSRLVQTATPVASDVTGLEGRVVEVVAAGSGFPVGVTCVRTDDGAVWCWGANSSGMLGRNAPASTGLPGAIDRSMLPGTGRAVRIAGGGNTFCLIETAGGLWCWGDNSRRQLATVEIVTSLVPIAVDLSTVSAGARAVEVAIGEGRTVCALTDADALVCWGHNAEGEAGVGSTTMFATPAQVTVPDRSEGSRLTGLRAGRAHMCVLETTGRAWCWGGNTRGAVGVGSTEPVRTPAPVALDEGVRLVALAAGAAHTCGLDDEGGVWCWGDNRAGQASPGSALESVLRPTRLVLEGLEEGVTLDGVWAGADATCVRDTTSTLRCWGADSGGSLGLGTFGSAATPTPIAAAGLPAGHRVAEVAMANHHTVVVLDDAWVCGE